MRLDWTRLSVFLGKIYEGYRRDVEYHNDLHAADVMQMCYLMLTEGEMVAKAELSSLDSLSILISAVCHDFAHDGFNNGFHVNAVTDRAIRYSDQSVQENYHVAESFMILNNDDSNFLIQFNKDDFTTFRKRFIGIILATDMARHVSDLGNFKSLIDNINIKDGNIQELFDKSSVSKEFDTK